MLILRFFKQRMAVKVFLGIGLVVGGLLLVQAWTDSQRELRNLRKQSEDSATDIARLFIGAVEHSMLGGAGIDVKALVAELEERLHEEHQQKRLPEVEVQIFDQRGIEVFAPKPPVPAPEELPPDVAAVLASGQRREGADGRVYRPVKNAEACYESCHENDSPLRGVIALELDRAACAETRREVLPRVITEGFTHVMTAERADLLDAYFGALAENAPLVEGVAVFDATAEQSYGPQIAHLDRADVQSLLDRGPTTTYLRRDDGGVAASIFSSHMH